MTWTSPRPGRSGSVRRSSKRSFRGSPIELVSGLKDMLLSKGAWQRVATIEDLRHAQVSNKWLHHLTRAREVS